jgi:hypothetical protein
MLKRSGFRRPVLERVLTVHKPIPIAHRRAASMATVDGQAAEVIEKFDYVRSRPLLNAIKALDCQHCGARGPSDPAHSNQGCHGKGKSIKASDIFVAALCRTCHRQVDQSSTLSQEERLAIWMPAWRKTVREVLRRGTWPLTVPIPDTRRLT